MLAAPPAAAMTYENDSSGLDPSVYGGGGSPSSDPLSPCFSLESSALVSATTEEVAGGVYAGYSSKGGAGAAAVREAACGSVTEGLNGSGSPSRVA